MSMFTLSLFTRLEKMFGVAVSRVVVSRNVGRSSYDWSTDTIEIFRGGRTEQEQVFSALHEYRHAMQVASNMFPEILTFTHDNLPNSLSYFDLPWEKDANAWALEQGIKLGFFEEGFKPHWLL